MNSGFILLHRKMLENAIFYNANYYQIWCYILLKVNHKDTEIIWNGEKKVLKKGSGIFSQKKIAEELKLGIGTVNRAINYLKAETQIQVKSSNRFTEIQVVNWDVYQDIERVMETRRKPDGKQAETQRKQTIHDNTLIHDNTSSNIPSLDQVIDFFVGKGFSKELATRAFNHYDLADWKDTKGKKVKNWKQKMNTVWMKEENKSKVQKINGINSVIL